MPTASEALSYMNSQNQRVRANIPEFIAKNSPPIFIYNIYPREHRIQLLSRVFVIPPCKAGEPYSKPLKIDGAIIDEYDLGDGTGRMAFNIVDGRRLAVDDILGRKSFRPGLDILTTNLEWWGVFVAAQEKPSKTELDFAKKSLVEFLTLMVQEGDRLFQDRNPLFQPMPIHREAALYLGLKREWCSAPMQLVECPGCGTNLRPNVAKCANCGAILNVEKCRELGILPVGFEVTPVVKNAG